MTLIEPVAQSLGCGALKDGLLYVFFLLALAGSTAAFVFVVNWIVRSFADRGIGSKKNATFSKGASR